MSSLTLGPAGLLRDEHELEKHSSTVHDAKYWYRNAINFKNLLGALSNWPQVVFAGLRGDEREEAFPGSSTQKAGGFGHHVTLAMDEEVENVIASAFADLPRPDVNEFTRYITSIDLAVSTPSRWTQVFAYTDFGAMPAYVCLLVLAATADEKGLPSRRVFAELCRSNLRERGIADSIFTRVVGGSITEPNVDRYVTAAHMVACLEEPVATAGYLDAAVHFEQYGDRRSALACIYRNTRCRLRDNQLSELDDEIKTFNFEVANIDTMLAILTATTPVKSRLSNRKLLFRRIRAKLKKRGQLEKGLLDGLN